MCSKRGIEFSVAVGWPIRHRAGSRRVAVTGALCGMLGGLAILVAGCGRPSGATPTSGGATVGGATVGAPDADTVAAAGDTPAAGSRDVSVSLVDHADVLAAVESHRGKVVVLDCWSTSCPPCIKEFPGLVALARRHPDRVACLSLAFDYEGLGAVEDALGPVREFLARVDDGSLGNLHHMLGRVEADELYRAM
jgi:thiol-disulfide isomerase/thioredoxin